MADSAGRRFDRLVDIMRTLRGPDGCPWDREQTLRSLRPFVLEETYELLDALDRGDHDALREELGDFLFEAVFLARIAEEEGRFAIGDAIDAIADKLVRRHPHVFTGDGRPLAEARESLSSAAVVERWEELKAKERRADADAAREKTILSGVPRTLPALLRAYELGARASAVGFDWVQSADVLAKIEEELAELKGVVQRDAADRSGVEEEMGDLLFTLVNLSRKLGIEPEAALRMANDKFQRRFEGMERAAAAEQLSLKGLSAQEWERRWASQKRSEGAEGTEGGEGLKGAKD
jgi:MazG family protein